MRALVALCLLGACAGSPRATSGDQRVELPGEAWHVTYKLVLDDPAAPRLEGWAQITNSSTEDWSEAKLTLATRESRIRDLDGDGLRDRVDLCPHDPEDFDGHNDDDGCPEADNDSDRIIDASDKCPNDAETYNGHDDDDGCPDRGPVIVHGPHHGIREWVYFTVNSDVIKPASLPLLEAVVATINGNPEIRMIEIGGHTDRTERDPWSLSLRRAAAVNKWLVDKGVAVERLAIAPYATTQPMAAESSAADLARSRRVGFEVAARDADPPVVIQPPPRPPFDPPRSEPFDDLRYDLAQSVSFKRGASALIAILDKPITARALAMFEPTTDMADSMKHPFRAVRIVNTTGFVLQRGPIEIVDGGRVILRGELRRTGLGDTARIRGELDRTTAVHVTRAVDLAPRQILGVVDRGDLIVEDTAIETTTYTVIAASSLAIELHHRRLPGESSDRLIETREVAASTPVVVDIVEPQPRRGRHPIESLSAKQLAAYLDRSKLPANVHDRLRAALTPMIAIETHRTELATLRAKLAAIADRWHRTQRPLDRTTRTELDEVARAIGVTTEQLAREQTRLGELLRDLQLAPPPP